MISTLADHRDRRPAEGVRVRVLVWNLFHGRAVPPAGRGLLSEFAGLIARWEWDVALLQEVPPWWAAPLARGAGAEQRAALTSRNALLPVRRALAARRPDLMKSNGGGANAVLARSPIASHRAVRLRISPERRVAQMVRLASGPCLVNYHASTTPRRATEELARIWELALPWARDAPLVVGGDLNLRTPRAPSPTIAHVATRDVDHVFVRGLVADAPTQQPARSMRQPGGTHELSDHPPLIVSLASPT